MTTFKRSDPFPFEFEVQSRPTPLYAARFENKALVVPSDCLVHPKYQALRPPRSKVAGCVCAEIYRQQEERD